VGNLDENGNAGYWTVHLTDEHLNIEKTIGTGGIVLRWSSIESLRLVKYIDPYGNTVFNYLQAADLILDLEYLKTLEENNCSFQLGGNQYSVIATIDEIISLAIDCKNDRHKYILFSGD
jgi:hypothetical protein